MFGAGDNSTAAPIDRAVLAEISRGEPAVERRLLDVFQRANAVDASALEEALEKQDVAAVIRGAHRMVGASRMAGATTLAAICDSIAQAARCGDWSVVMANRGPLHREIERLNAYLRACLDSES